MVQGPVFARAFPFAVFIALIALQPLLEGRLDARWLVVGRGLVVGAILVWLWPRYTELKTGVRHQFRLARFVSDTSLGLVVGVLVFVAWIHLDAPWNSFEMGQGFVPLRSDGSLDMTLVALRLLGLAVVVPVMEELFWRSLVMRWIERKDFLAVDPRRVGAVAFGLSSALFALEHSQWLAGLLAGLAYGALYLRSGNLWIPILSHATTNGILGLWIVATGSWRYW